VLEETINANAELK